MTDYKEGERAVLTRGGAFFATAKRASGGWWIDWKLEWMTDEALEYRGIKVELRADRPEPPTNSPIAAGFPIMTGPPTAQPSPWLPITDAQKDGARYLVTDGKTVTVSRWMDRGTGPGGGRSWESDDHWGSPLVWTPTHYMPIPPLPGTTEAES